VERLVHPFAGRQEVRAVAPGRVVFADWLRGFGNLLIIDHGKSYLTIYGNNESVLKQVGDAGRYRGCRRNRRCERPGNMESVYTLKFGTKEKRSIPCAGCP